MPNKKQQANLLGDAVKTSATLIALNSAATHEGAALQDNNQKLSAILKGKMPETGLVWEPVSPGSNQYRAIARVDLDLIPDAQQATEPYIVEVFATFDTLPTASTPLPTQYETQVFSATESTAGQLERGAPLIPARIKVERRLDGKENAYYFTADVGSHLSAKERLERYGADKTVTIAQGGNGRFGFFDFQLSTLVGHASNLQQGADRSVAILGTGSGKGPIAAFMLGVGGIAVVPENPDLGLVAADLAKAIAADVPLVMGKAAPKPYFVTPDGVMQLKGGGFERVGDLPKPKDIGKFLAEHPCTIFDSRAVEQYVDHMPPQLVAMDESHGIPQELRLRLAEKHSTLEKTATPAPDQLAAPEGTVIIERNVNEAQQKGNVRPTAKHVERVGDGSQDPTTTHVAMLEKGAIGFLSGNADFVPGDKAYKADGDNRNPTISMKGMVFSDQPWMLKFRAEVMNQLASGNFPNYATLEAIEGAPQPVTLPALEDYVTGQGGAQAVAQQMQAAQTAAIRDNITYEALALLTGRSRDDFLQMDLKGELGAQVANITFKTPIPDKAQLRETLNSTYSALPEAQREAMVTAIVEACTLAIEQKETGILTAGFADQITLNMDDLQPQFADTISGSSPQVEADERWTQLRAGLVMQVPNDRWMTGVSAKDVLYVEAHITGVPGQDRMNDPTTMAQLLGRCIRDKAGKGCQDVYVDGHVPEERAYTVTQAYAPNSGALTAEFYANEASIKAQTSDERKPPTEVAGKRDVVYNATPPAVLQAIAAEAAAQQH